MLRVWGGGFYEEDRFYDLCDRYGILVWQDFVFACSIYPLDRADFVANLQQEMLENVRRLRHRASLALWCGNNEMEWGWESWGWAKPDIDEQQMAALQKLAETLPSRAQPARTRPSMSSRWTTGRCCATPTSPSSTRRCPPGSRNGTPTASTGPRRRRPTRPSATSTRQDRGDAHYWDVWHGRQPFTAYRSQYPRFMSEFGFQALPPLATISTYADEADWNMTSYVMEHHQRSGTGNGLMLGQMTDNYRTAKDFPSLVYLSMMLQAEGIRYGVEHWRRSMDRVSGTLYWQLNDCWPVASWSSLDSFGRWKALHYAAGRFYAPVLLSLHDRGPLIDIHVTSDLQQPWAGTVRWSLETLGGEVVEKGEEPVTAGPQADTQVRALDFTTHVNDENSRKLVFVAELWQADQLVATAVSTFVPNKHLELVDPQLRATVRASDDGPGSRHQRGEPRPPRRTGARRRRRRLQRQLLRHSGRSHPHGHGLPAGRLELSHRRRMLCRFVLCATSYV